MKRPAMGTISFFLREKKLFEPDDVAAMSRALDTQIRDDSYAREIIAERIIDLARLGDRSPNAFAIGC